MSVEDWQRKWKTLRDHFVRELKKVKKKKTRTAGACYVSCWPLFDQLLLLQDSVKHRQFYDFMNCLLIPIHSLSVVGALTYWWCKAAQIALHVSPTIEQTVDRPKRNLKDNDTYITVVRILNFMSKQRMLLNDSTYVPVNSL